LPRVPIAKATMCPELGADNSSPTRLFTQHSSACSQYRVPRLQLVLLEQSQKQR